MGAKRGDKGRRRGGGAYSAGQMCGKSKRSKFGLLQNDPSPGLLHAIGSTSPLQIPLPSVETNITAATTATHAARLP